MWSVVLLLLLHTLKSTVSSSSIESEFNNVFLSQIIKKESLTRTEVRHTAEMGRGVYATTDVEQGDVLFTVRTKDVHLLITDRIEYIYICIGTPGQCGMCSNHTKIQTASYGVRDGEQNIDGRRDGVVSYRGESGSGIKISNMVSLDAERIRVTSFFQ